MLRGLLLNMRGEGGALPAMPSLKSVGLAWLGGCLAIATIALLGNTLSVVLVLGSFGASCVLVFAYPDVPFSQPRNIVFGHVLSSFVGLAFLTAFGPQWWALALAAGTAIAAMMLTRTVHPPAGSNPVIVFLTHPSWGFLLFPTLVGAAILVMVALVYNNVSRSSAYPKYW